jgi:hypothetical protein
LAETTPPRTIALAETSSFRDWDGRVFSVDGRILRGLTQAGRADWEALSASELFKSFTVGGELVGTVDLPSGSRGLYFARPR